MHHLTSVLECGILLIEQKGGNNMSLKMMKCGHVANSTICRKGKCVEGCGMCGEDGLIEDTEFDVSQLEGRKARCTYCGCIVDSKLTLPFFHFNPNREFDEYYCGCRGWD